MKKFILALTLIVGMVNFAFSQTKKREIRSISITFNTTTNDKDHDTYLDVYLSYHDY